MSENGKENKALGVSVLWKLLERASVQIITLATQIVLARIIAPEKFGSLSIIVVFYNIADLLVQKGFGSALIRKKNITQADIDSVTVVSSIVAFMSFVVILLGAPLVGVIYHDESIVNPLRALSVNLLISPLYCVYNSMLIRNMRFKVIFYRGLAASIISGVLGISLAYLGFEVWALVAQMVANQIVITVMMIKAEKVQIRFRFDKEAFKEVFGFGRNVLLTELLLTLVENLRTLLIGKKYSTADLAYYDRGQIYPATLMRAVNDTLFSTLLPHLSKNQDKLDEIRRQFIRLAYILCLIIMPIFIGLASVSNEVILLLLGEKWSFAIIYMEIFCLYQALFPYQIISKATLYAIGVSERVLRLEIIKAVFSLCLMIISLYFGVIYVAASLIIVRVFSDVLYVLSVEKSIGCTHMIGNTWKPILASILMFSIVYSLRVLALPIYISLFVKIIAGVVSYSAFIMLFDKELAHSIFLKLRRIK